MSKVKGVRTKERLHPDTYNKSGKGLFNRPAIHLLLILITGFIVYSNTFYSPFQWDEIDYIIKNPIIKNFGFFTAPSRAEGFPVYDGLITRYMGYLTFALNYRHHGFDVTGYHIVNLSIHIINAFLVYFFLLFTFRTPYFREEQLYVSSKLPANSLQNDSPVSRYSGLIPLAVALLFVVHPIQTEAVTYVFQRFASLVSMFYLLSLVLYIQGRLLTERVRGDRQEAIGKALSKKNNTALETSASFSILALTFYFLSLVSAICAMKTKENAFTLPVMMTIYEFLFFSGQLKYRVLRLMPFLLTMLIIPVTFIGLDGSPGELISQVVYPQSLVYHDLSSGEYLFTQFGVIITYIRLLFFPAGQNLIHDVPLYRSFFDPAVMTSLAFHLMILGTGAYFVVRSRGGEDSEDGTRLWRMIAFGIFWFYITLSVESSVITIAMVMTEYRVYLPSAGIFMAFITGLFLVIRKFPDLIVTKGKNPAAIFAVLILILGFSTYARNNLWTDKIALWEDVVHKNAKSERGLNNLGTAYYEQGLYDRAIEQFNKVIVLNPAHALAYVNLGSAYATAGRYDLAVGYLEKAVALNPENSLAHANLARAYRETGMLEKAVESYSMAINLNPYHITSYLGLGSSYKMLGRFDSAIEVYTQLIQISPDNPEAYRNRGIIHTKKGDLNNARKDFQISCDLGSMISCDYLKSSRFH